MKTPAKWKSVYPYPIKLVIVMMVLSTSCGLENLHEDVENPEIVCEILAQFEEVNTRCKAPCQVTFNNNSQNATTYSWDFGDGNTSSEASPVHTFTQPGDYVVELTASDGNCEEKISKTITIESVTFELTFGTSENEVGRSVKQTADDGFILVGYQGGTIFNNEGEDGYILKVDKTGQLAWTETFGGPDIDSDRAYDVIEDKDGNYALTGFNDSFDEEDGDEDGNMAYVRINANGNLTRNNHFGNERDQTGYSIQQTSDNGFILGGSTVDFFDGNLDAYIVKVRSTGFSWDWRKSFGGSGDDAVFATRQTSDDGYISVGFSSSFGNQGRDVYLLKINSSGNEEWIQTFGKTLNDQGNHLEITSDGGYIIAGYLTENDGRHIYLIKTDRNGDEDWSRTFGPGTGNCVQQTSDGGYILTGDLSGGDIFLLKTDEDGTETWRSTFGGSAPEDSWYVRQTSDNGYVIVGNTESFGNGNKDVYLIKTDSEGNI